MSNPELWQAVGAQLAPSLAPASTPKSPIQQRRRRGFDSRVDDGREAVSLVRDDGVLRWVYEAPQVAQRRARRSWRAVGVDERDVVQRMESPPLGRNQITGALEALDDKLNSARGLHRWRNKAWQAVAADELQALEGRVLLLVHGTFSASAMYDTELGATAQGRELLGRWSSGGKPYAAVLGFDHATLSVAPWLNALALVRALQGLPRRTRVDVVCHSRGGLVACWALKLAPQLPVDQVVFVGSPLTGTSLAAPDKLRDALDLLANIADAVSLLGRGAALAFPPAMPIALGAAGLAKVLGRVLNLGAALPLADAAVGLVPGLMAQSRVDNNLELRELFPLEHKATLAAVGVAFKPDEVKEPVWKFWQRFSNLGDQLKYAGADLIFRQPNDLVVDTSAMSALGQTLRMAPGDWYDLGERAHTHHCNYFRDADVLKFLDGRLR